jgi:hypothetical protein
MKKQSITGKTGNQTDRQKKVLSYKEDRQYDIV